MPALFKRWRKICFEKRIAPVLSSKDGLVDNQALTTDAPAHSTSLVDTILGRRSIRRYQQKEIPRDTLDKILETGRNAPSAMNRQPWHFIVDFLTRPSRPLYPFSTRILDLRLYPKDLKEMLIWDSILTACLVIIYVVASMI
ncbi:nitroreductase family protein [Candidatus Bathyarchaeota archaeon]|nr:nitroreductase family protein [Candidatus Bathyarchaeota archaeon]